MNEFERIFNDLTKKDAPHFLWLNWMDWVIDANLITNENRHLDFHGHEHEYYELYKAWLKIVGERLNNGEYWCDYLGEFFEEHLITQFNRKNDNQFFTPSDVSQLMTNLCLATEYNDTSRYTYDCACGSGRLLLDAHRYNPQGIMIGWDYDTIASRMAVLNFYIHGIRGSIIRMNTMTLEFFEAWRINNYMGYGLNVPHIELVDEFSAYDFIGTSNIHDNDVDNVVLDQEVKTVNTKQVSLEAFM